MSAMERTFDFGLPLCGSRPLLRTKLQAMLR
jgi:hypothetical protein